jgi:hypothetical protein
MADEIPVAATATIGRWGPARGSCRSCRGGGSFPGRSGGPLARVDDEQGEARGHHGAEGDRE